VYRLFELKFKFIVLNLKLSNIKDLMLKINGLKFLKLSNEDIAAVLGMGSLPMNTQPNIMKALHIPHGKNTLKDNGYLYTTEIVE